LARRLVEALGHVGPGGLVPERHQADAVLFERCEQWIDLGGRETENEAHALVREATCEQRAAVQLGLSSGRCITPWRTVGDFRSSWEAVDGIWRQGARLGADRC